MIDRQFPRIVRFVMWFLWCLGIVGLVYAGVNL